MSDTGRTPSDPLVLAAVLRVAREYAHAGWEEMEPALAACWERLRQPSSPEWKDVADTVRAYCEQMSGSIDTAPNAPAADHPDTAD
jgi:hypothetical protein